MKIIKFEVFSLKIKKNKATNKLIKMKPYDKKLPMSL